MNRTVIGVTCDTKDNKLSVSNDIAIALTSLGAICAPLPYGSEKEKFCELLSFCDGFVFSGGGDIHPSFYGKAEHGAEKNICIKRDLLEHDVFNLAFSSCKPILGICRGMQVINVFLGGTLRQHINGHIQASPRDAPSHNVVFTQNNDFVNLVYKKKPQSTCAVNSFHHQCIDRLAPGLVCDAVSDDGITEAFHLCDKRFLLGVQWHPECTFEKDIVSRSIFESFILECKKTKV